MEKDKTYLNERRGLVSIDFEAKHQAPTVDDICTAMRSKRLVATDNVKEMVRVAFMGKNQHLLEQFNFGHLTLPNLNEAIAEGFEFLKWGCFQMPYPVCFYRSSVSGAETIGESFLVVSAEDTARVGVVHFIHCNDAMMATHCVVNLTTKLDPNHMKQSIPLELPFEEADFWQARVVTDNGAPTHHQLVDCGLSVIGLTMVLNTKGIRKDRVAPPEKPNKARARAGRPLLPYVTRVYTDVYRQAAEPGSGTHSSPRPHRRRAHVRTYLRDDGTLKSRVPIAAMLVNWDGRPLSRGEYEVNK